MKVLIRADASREIGTGHVIRCLALAQELKSHGHQVEFMSLPLPGDMISVVEGHGFAVTQNPQPGYDWCVIDHYGISGDSEKVFRKISKKIAVIDDWTNHVHDAELLIDPSISSRSRERQRLNPKSEFLAGAEWLLLRRDFAEMRKRVKSRTQFKNVLVFFGGSDPRDLIAVYHETILRMDRKNFHYHFLIGHSHARTEEFKKLPSESNITFHFAPESVAKIMSSMDLYLGSAGTITWERMCLGLTGVIVSIVDNQEDNAQTAHDLGFHLYLGRHNEVTPENAILELEKFAQNPAKMTQLSKKCFETVDGLGAERLVKKLEQLVKIDK